MYLCCNSVLTAPRVDACALDLQITSKYGQPNAQVTTLLPNKINVILPGVSNNEQISECAALKPAVHHTGWLLALMPVVGPVWKAFWGIP
jgi:hypothetical protein